MPPEGQLMKPILIIDDSPIMLMSISRILQKGGFTVESCANGQIAIDKIKGGFSPAIILTDLNMPVLDGFGFIKQARQLAATRFTPIVILTTESATQKKDTARAAGATGWLTKPAEPHDLLATLKQLLPASVT
jgi:two-component system chemotaxis response regulator CheY